MSTKFSIRPAPRKRPWICKAPPGGHEEQAVPATLLATFVCDIIAPPPLRARHHGSMQVHQTATPFLYRGTWTDGPDYYDLQLNLPAAIPADAPHSSWVFGIYSWIATWPFKILPDEPPIFYQTALQVQGTELWHCELLLTW